MIFLILLAHLGTYNFVLSNTYSFDVISSIIQFFQNLIASIFKTSSTTSTSIATSTLQISISSTSSTSSTASSSTSTSTTTTIKQNSSLTQNSAYVSNFIIYNPVNLTNVTYISKFRSCWGHDISVLVPGTNGTHEPLSSKRHYFGSISYSKVLLYAPFTADVVYIDKSTELGHDIYLQSASSGNWLFDILHLDIASGITVNSMVKAGQIIGRANNSAAGQADIDVDLLQLGGNLTIATFSQYQQYINSSNPGQQVPQYLLKNYYNSTYDSIFRHMNASVYQQYVSHGVNLNSSIFSLQFRTSNPCTCQGSPVPGCHFVSGIPNQTIAIAR